ncbi:ribonuclease T2 [Macrolepiota fuliginosa MF-IS2]|uniref:ribonuclease T2 n=1 Tax=Macrolepiota fuliginosa MF-IS2 TaxID=1400762 RepID=A0A9P5XQR9_9AGAR|nr:ribonuclease T2 [Macrolepiota fuliginosa MF-IS2]
MKAKILVCFSLFAASAFGGSNLRIYPNLAACIHEPSFFSCENTAPIKNTCCSPTPGGLVLQTQFWNTYTGLERQGQRLPKGSWGIHGLWPDNCDSSFEQYCDPARQYDPAPSPSSFPNGTVIPAYKGPGVDTFIKKFSQGQLLDYMSKYWINLGAPSEGLWAHEFSKHATCTSTFDVACYGGNYEKHAEVIDYFEAVIRAFQLFPTYKFLAAGGVLPSNKTTYKLDDLEAIIKSQTGAVPFFGCANNGTVLNEVWYFNHVHGSEQFGSYKTIDSTTLSTCTRTGGIRYLERTPGSEQDASN